MSQHGGPWRNVFLRVTLELRGVGSESMAGLRSRHEMVTWAWWVGLVAHHGIQLPSRTGNPLFTHSTWDVGVMLFVCCLGPRVGSLVLAVRMAAA